MSRRCSVVVGNGSKSRRTKNGWHHLTTDKGWRRPFADPIPLPRGRELVTLKDAGTYITKLPKAEHEAPEWQAAAEALHRMRSLCKQSKQAIPLKPDAVATPNIADGRQS